MKLTQYDKPIGKLKASSIRPALSEEEYGYWAEICRQHGVNYRTFGVRCYRGWDKMEAATTPAATRQETVRRQGQEKRENGKCRFGRIHEPTIS